jgi:hypothetical protein
MDSEAGKWKTKKMRCQKKRMQIIREMRKKTYCTHISLKIEAAVCNGILLFAENLVIEIGAESV